MRQCLRIWANSSARVAAPRQSRPGSATTRIAPTAPRALSALRPSRLVRVPVRIALTARRPRPRPSRCCGNGTLAGKNRAACIPFSPSARKRPLPGNICAKCMLLEIKMARSSPYASISGRNRAIQDAWRANLAIKAPFSRRGPGNHAWREDVASAFPRSRARELAERALCPAARAWSDCRMYGSLPSRLSLRYSRPGSATYRCHSHVRAAPQRCRYSRPHSSPPPFTSRPPCSPCHPSHRPSRSGVGCRSGASRAHPPPAVPPRGLRARFR